MGKHTLIDNYALSDSTELPANILLEIKFITIPITFKVVLLAKMWYNFTQRGKYLLSYEAETHTLNSANLGGVFCVRWEKMT